MHVQSLIGGNRPRRGGPNNHIAFLCHGHAKGFGQFIVLGKAKTHVNRGVGFIGVFHFGFSQCRFTIKTPVHGLQTAIDIAFFEDFTERANFVGFIGKVHGLVRIVPFAQNAQAHEVNFLAFDLLACIGAGFFLHFARGQTTPVNRLDFIFNRHTVTIPPRHIRRVKSRHGFGLDNNVFEDFIDCVTDVNVAVGIRRTIVQNEFRTTRDRRADGFVAFLRLPSRNPLRFAFGQITPHREWRIQ